MKHQLNPISYSLPEKLEKAVQTTLAEWKNDNKIKRIWDKDAGVWTNSDEAKWLGWLDIVEKQLNDAETFKGLAEDVKRQGFTDILLLGMGGSSLGPEVLSMTFGKQKDSPSLHILDSTVPAQIKAVEAKIDVANTLFIVASKSGSTLEPNTFYQYFYERAAEAVGANNAGKQFLAITDPNSKMQKIAERDEFWKIFYGLPEIGGRFSVLSNFGMIPAAAMNLDVEDFLNRAREMADACKNENPDENPGAVLGTILGVCQTSGRDKLTIFTSADIFHLGAWLEQLIAESTGKNEVAIIPVDRESIQKPKDYGSDRVFVYLSIEGASDEATESQIEALEKSGQPVVRIVLKDKMNLGQEFFRWEFATAVAGAIMQINPFDQPDVEAAKIEAKKITDEYEKSGELPVETPFYEENGIALFTDEKNLAELNKSVGKKSLENYLKAHFSRIKKGDYFALLAYIEMKGDTEEFLQKIRHRILEKHKTATCLGFGPRFLHSTGQAYKGGANNGVFLQITSDDAEDFSVPKQKFTFGVVKSAQARGDFQVLLDRDRRALRVHLSADVLKDLAMLQNLLDKG